MGFDESERPVDSRLPDLLERIGRLLRSVRHRNERLNPAQWEALRYLGRANRYSRTPTALTHYLGATKGTVSQTVIALERKGLAAACHRPAGPARRAARPDRPRAGQPRERPDGRPAGRGRLRSCSGGWRRACRTCSLHLQHRNQHRPFGQCGTCRFFRRGAAIGEAGGPNRCGLTLEPLADFEAEQICAEHEAPAPVQR